MALMVSTTSGLVGSTYTSSIPAQLDMVPVYMKKKLLQIIERKLVFQQLGDKEDLPEGNGKVVRFLRYEKLQLPLTTITEGTTPTTLRELVTSSVEATVDQWGDVLGISDVANLTLFHKALQIGIERMGDQAAETIDREIQRVLLQGTTNIMYPVSTYSARTSITASDKINADVIRRAVASMRDAGVPDFNGDFIGVCDPFVEQDIISTPEYITAATTQNLQPLFGGRVNPPRWLGVRWMTSNHIPTIALDASSVGGSFTNTANANGETAMTSSATNSFILVGLNPSGFETHIGSTTTGVSSSSGAISFTTPSLTNVVAFNVYWSTTATGQKYIGTVLPSATVRVSGNGVNTTANGTTIFALAAVSTGAAAPVAPTSGINVHQTYIFGREAFGTVNLTNLITTLTPDVASDSDPLRQRRKAGWKIMFKALVKNPNYFRRIESEGMGNNSTIFGVNSSANVGALANLGTNKEEGAQ